MPARLILNADDFGLTPGINRAIAELHSAGALTSATLMANGPAFEDAVAIARTHPTLGVGCHIVLTDGTPVSPPSKIPTLIGPDGRSLHTQLSVFLRALLLGRITAADIYTEALAQIARIQSAGIPITHIDTHKHTHLFPAVLEPLLAACRTASVPAIRNPFEPAWSKALRHGSPMRRLAVRATHLLQPRFAALLAANPAIATTAGTLAISATGNLTSTTLAETLAALPPTGTYELCCHPGYNDSDLDRIPTRLRTHRNIEREALLAAIPTLLSQDSAPQLINYAALITSER